MGVFTGVYGVMGETLELRMQWDLAQRLICGHQSNLLCSATQKEG